MSETVESRAHAEERAAEQRYLDVLYARHGTPAGGEWTAWTSLWMDSMFFLGIVLLVLLFPDGRLPSRRWRPVLVALVVGSLALTLVRSLRPGLLDETSMPSPNPAGIEDADTILGIVEAIGVLLFVPATILSCGSMPIPPSSPSWDMRSRTSATRRSTAS